MTPAGRLYQAIFGIVLAVCVLLPIDERFRRVGDDFPFSFYPMFAGKRPARERPIYVVAVWDDGREEYVSTGRWSGGGFNEARTQLANAVKAGAPQKNRYCQKIATAVSRSKSLGGASRIEFRQASIDRAEWFLEGKVATDARVLHRCPVHP